MCTARAMILIEREIVKQTQNYYSERAHQTTLLAIGDEMRQSKTLMVCATAISL